jgi:hypothetical protein
MNYKNSQNIKYQFFGEKKKTANKREVAVAQYKDLTELTQQIVKVRKY